MSNLQSKGYQLIIVFLAIGGLVSIGISLYFSLRTAIIYNYCLLSTSILWMLFSNSKKTNGGN